MMNIIFQDQEIMILSNKQFSEKNRYVITFTDGSYVDIDTRTITNKGPGEITIYDLPMWPPMMNIIKEKKVFNSIEHLNVIGDMNNIIILPNDEDECIVSIGGANDFVQNSSFYQEGNHLFIQTPRSKRNVNVTMGSMWVNGKRLSPQLDDDFGYIEIRCNNLYSLCVNGSGSGEIFAQIPIKNLEANIKGSASIHAIQLENAELNISGSGSLVAVELNGDLYGRISGSGNIDILTGDIQHADVEISGSGDLMLGALVKTAALSHYGSGNIIIAHVLNQHTIQSLGSGIVRVLKVGI